VALAIWHYTVVGHVMSDHIIDEAMYNAQEVLLHLQQCNSLFCLI